MDISIIVERTRKSSPQKGYKPDSREEGSYYVTNNPLQAQQPVLHERIVEALRIQLLCQLSDLLSLICIRALYHLLHVLRVTQGLQRRRMSCLKVPHVSVGIGEGEAS